MHYKLTGQVEPQMSAFMAGFSELVDPSLLKAFDDGELELLMGGMPHVNVKVRQHSNIHSAGNIVITLPNSLRVTVLIGLER